MPEVFDTPPQTVEEKEKSEQIENSQKEVEEAKTETEQAIKNEAWLSFSQWLGLETSGETFSATRLQGGGSFFKWGKLQTDIYAQLDLTNGKQPGGFFRANKAVYKGVNLDWVYQFTSTNNDKARLGLTYRGRTESGGYAFGAFPLTQEGGKFWADAELYLSLDRKIGKSWKASAWVLADIKGKAFWGEAEYVHDLTKNLSAFVQARYGWPIKDPSITGVAGIRLNIK